MLQEVYRIRELSRQLVRLLDVLKGRYRQAAHSYPQAHILVELQARGSLHANDLSDILRMDKSTISRMLRDLIRKKLVRATPHESDKRYKLIQLTAKGQDEAAKLHTLGNTHIGNVIAGLTEADTQTIVKGLDLYVTALLRQEWRSGIQIRAIQNSDELAVADIIKTSMTEFGAVGPGYSIIDDEVNAMFEAYSQKRWAYWVADRKGEVVGGAGIAPLKDGDPDTCELKKMYFKTEARGKGLGDMMIRLCLEKARELQFKKCYLETLKRMTAANKLYEKHGFQKLPKPLGHTGHYKTDNWYLKVL